MPPDNEAPAPDTELQPPSDEAQAPDEASFLTEGSEACEPPPPTASRTHSWRSATLAGCIVLEAITLLVLVAFCATLVGFSFLRQALLTSEGTATPAVASLITPEPAPTETVIATVTETPTPLIPTITVVTPTVAAPTRTATRTPAPRRYSVFLPLIVRAPPR
jgi:hypothetical protein